MGWSHGFGVLGPADAVLHQSRERHCLKLLQVAATIEHLILILTPSPTPHAEKDECQDDDYNGSYWGADSYTKNFAVQFALLTLVVSLAPYFIKCKIIINLKRENELRKLLTGKLSCPCRCCTRRDCCSNCACTNCTVDPLGSGRWPADLRNRLCIRTWNCPLCWCIRHQHCSRSNRKSRTRSNLLKDH